MGDVTQEEVPEEKKIELFGTTVSLKNDRSVYLGRPVDKNDDSWYLDFKNAEAKTSIRLSGEAMQVLMELYASYLHAEAVGHWSVSVSVVEKEPTND